MKKFLKNNFQIIIGIIIGFSTISFVVYAATINYDGIDVGYDYSNSNFKDSQNNYVEDVQTAIDELYTIYSNKQQNSSFKLGDYFTLVPDASSYTLTTAESGYKTISSGSYVDTTTSITPNELTLWRVIDIHSDGSVDAVSEYVSSTTIGLGSIIGYERFVEILQNVAAQYAKAGYTIGGQTPTIVDTSSFDDSTTNNINQSISMSNSQLQEYKDGVRGDTLYQRDTQLIANVYKSNTSRYTSNGLKAYRVNSTSSATAYWLASRYSSTSSSNQAIYFYDRYISSSGSVSSDFLRYCSNNQTTGIRSCSQYFRAYSVRPIITLKSAITITGGSGTLESPYQIG